MRKYKTFKCPLCPKEFAFVSMPAYGVHLEVQHNLKDPKKHWQYFGMAIDMKPEKLWEE
jgi:hypothetical protein